MIINRHGDFDAKELYRLLKKGGIFITQQVGSDNDRELVEMVLQDTKKPFPDFSVDKCFEQLLKMQQMVEENGKVEGTIHRYMIVAKK